MGLTSSSGSELNIATLHVIKLLALGSLGTFLRHTIPMSELAVQDVAEDLGVAVRMRREAIPCRDTVLVQDSKTAKAHEAVVEIIGEAEGVEGFEPAAMLGISALIGAAEHDLGVGERA